MPEQSKNDSHRQGDQGDGGGCSSSCCCCSIALDNIYKISNTCTLACTCTMQLSAALHTVLLKTTEENKIHL